MSSDRKSWPHIFVYCDAPAHPGRRVAVTNYRQTPDGGWTEELATRAPVDGTTAAHHLIGDRPAPSGWALDPEVSNADVRDHVELTCRKCNQAGAVRVRSTARLFAVLDGWRHAGVSEVSLAMVAASLGRQSGN